MPFLRAVGPSAPQPPLEIRSAKTLIGSGASKCDLVLPRDRGVLDLHALLNLGDDQATATLVPFSASGDGACFLNGRVVPPEGATVVHGDRIAFGSADNAYVFSLTDTNTSKPAEAVSLQNSRSFRRALDALRGDRAPPTSVPTVSQSTKRETDTRTRSLSTSASRERLERFLLDASTDSLLGDFVERKLRRSTSGAESRGVRPQQRPTAMEPPPSLSASSVGSIQSSLNDSILNRTANEQRDTDPLLSTAERNYAEIEKLRLSQRLREVNNVLNGHLNFSSSYLSTERRSSGSASMRYSSPLKPDRKRAAELEDDQEEEEEEEGSLEELPTLIEKPKRKPLDNGALTPLKASQAAKLSPKRSVQSSMASIRGRSLGDNPTTTHEDSLGNDDEVGTPVDESLPSFSEAILKHKRTRSLNDGEERVTDSLPPSSALDSPSVRMSNQPQLITDRPKPRPQLHQQLIDRTLRRKRHETMIEAFHRWRRGLRIQQQRRQVKTKQLQLVERKLQLLRRNHSFSRWRQWTERKQQVLQCREEALEKRQESRRKRSYWNQWMVMTAQAKLRRRLLSRLVMSVMARRKRSGFAIWKTLVESTRVAAREQDLTNRLQARAEQRLHAIATNHHQARGRGHLLQRIVRAWRQAASVASKRKRVLRRMLTWHYRRHQLRAWATWRHATAMKRQAEDIGLRRQAELAETTAKATQQFETHEQQLREQYEKQLNDLRVKLEEQQHALRAIEREKLEVKQRLAEAKASARAQWNLVAERLLKQTVATADAQITLISTRLETFLQQMDVEPENARFQAASFLVESMLEQKVRHVNERVEAQQDLLRALEDGSVSSGAGGDTKQTAGAWKSALTSNARFLVEMVQQRYARLHQLYQAVAKLAATTVEAQHTRTGRPGGGAATARVDAVKFKHAAFLTDAMHDRTLQHLEAVLAIQHRRFAASGLSVSSSREARKF